MQECTARLSPSNTAWTWLVYSDFQWLHWPLGLRDLQSLCDGLLHASRCPPLQGPCIHRLGLLLNGVVTSCRELLSDQSQRSAKRIVQCAGGNTQPGLINPLQQVDTATAHFWQTCQARALLANSQLE